jgi:hypothetical protein
MPDPATIVSAIPAVKAAFDALRAAIGLVKDTKDLLPKEEKAKADAITAALATAESSSRIAEAEVAKALGYELCKCNYPPTIMLTVGAHTGRTAQGQGPVYECPRCGYNTAYPHAYQRLSAKSQVVVHNAPDGPQVVLAASKKGSGSGESSL